MNGTWLRGEGEIRCQGCGTEITWAPVVEHRRKKESQAPMGALHYYCCQDCLEGRGCDCGARMEMEEERREGDSMQAAAIGNW